MQDPKDPGTLDLIEACQRPLTGAARQKRRRDKLKKLKEAGALFDLQMTSDELHALRAALGCYADRYASATAFGGDVAERLWRRLTCLQVGEYYKGDPVWSAEALRADAERLRDELASRPKGSLSPNDYSIQWLSLRDRSLLAWARRNEELVKDATPEQAYPTDPERRNLLGKALADMQTLSGRHTVLLQQARELSQLVFEAGLTPRLSSPGGLLRQLREHAELYDVRAPYPAEGREDVEALKAELATANAAAAHAQQLAREVKLLEDERNKAFAAYQVLERRLRDAGLSTDYRG